VRIAARWKKKIRKAHKKFKRSNTAITVRLHRWRTTALHHQSQ
jgi:hypothetical protein